MQTKTKVSTVQKAAKRRPKATRKKATERTPQPVPVAYPVTLQVRVTDEQAEAVREKAERTSRTLSEHLRLLITRDLEGPRASARRKSEA